MTMRPEPYRHLENDAIFDGLEAFERQAAELGVSAGGLALAWALGTRRLGGHRPAAAGAPRTGSRGALPRPLAGRARGSRLAVPDADPEAHEVERLLDMPGCMAAMEEALVALARGEFVLPLRPIVVPPGETTCRA